MKPLRVFVTGGTGYIGSAVTRALVLAGHEVTGLVRSAASAGTLESLGGRAIHGDLLDVSSYLDAARDHDASIHMAFIAGPSGVASDRAAIEALLRAARDAGTSRTVVYTSGVLCLGNTGDTPADEDSPASPHPVVAWRPAHERLVLEAASPSVSAAVVRPGFVYGGEKGLLAGYFQSATTDGAAAFVGDGTNRFALVHREDLAALYRRAVEAQARGMFHGVDGAAPRIADLARAASEAAGRDGRTRSIPLSEARESMGSFADALCADQVVIARRSRELGWNPAHGPALPSMSDAFTEWRVAGGAPT
jgi:nucleoside-diphosphate-sugar epimerase